LLERRLEVPLVVRLSTGTSDIIASGWCLRRNSISLRVVSTSE
jgi:hypothetical protein